MTKVLRNLPQFAIAPIIALTLMTAAAISSPPAARGMDKTPADAMPTDAPSAKPGEALYLELSQVTLDATRVYRIREASLDRAAIHITFEDGTIAFTHDVMGRITGAFFEGDGEVLLSPPNEVERTSMAMFTGMAILEERFATAYFRFNDDVAAELRPGLRPPEDAQEFVNRWSDTARNLAQQDALRLLLSFSRNLPIAGDAAASGTQAATGESSGVSSDHMLHARVQGTKLGVFDVYFDSLAGEEVQAGQAKPAENGNAYYDVWTQFSVASGGLLAGPPAGSEKTLEDPVVIRHFAIRCDVTPPKQIHAEAKLQIDFRQNGERTLLFELSRFLDVESVQLDGQAIEFLHNPSGEGTHLARQGNDLVAVILPKATRNGETHQFTFVYGGEVLAEAGKGLLYVGARGTWYPNRGLVMADFDLEFHYPATWTLVATGEPAPVSASAVSNGDGEQISQWVSSRPIPVAGFNLGKYQVATAKAGSVTVETYATAGVERDFPNPPALAVQPTPQEVPLPPQIIARESLSPARNALSVAETAARAIQFYADRFGPFPYGHLALTQMPGGSSQGWPGLVFLSSYAFLDDQQRKDLRFTPLRSLVEQQITPHETAHQWWGDLIAWSTYRDQWISEGLANYSALMILQEKDPDGFREIMEKYRRELLEKDKSGSVPKDAGPVTLGVRLESSRSPGGYDAISYGRSTWLFHMLRTMLQDGSSLEKPGKVTTGSDEPFVRALRNVRERFAGKSISTRELLDVFAEELPPTLHFEGKPTLDWFLAGWVNGMSLPKLELRSVKLTPQGGGKSGGKASGKIGGTTGGTLVSGTILQKGVPSNLVTSVPIYGAGSGRKLVLVGRVFADGEESSFRVSAPPGITKIVLDPYETILTAPK